MNDAGRKWFFKVEEMLKKLGCQQAKLDHCKFFYNNGGRLDRIILVWVDNIFHAGTRLFEEQVMAEVTKKFLIGKMEEESFMYIGLNIETSAKGITLDQIHYIKEKLELAVLRGTDVNITLDKKN